MKKIKWGSVDLTLRKPARKIRRQTNPKLETLKGDRSKRGVGV